MENRRKFYDGGHFGNVDIQRRFDYVCWALDAYGKKFLDWQDLTVAIKNAFASKVYVSCGVVKAYPASPQICKLLGPRLSKPYIKLVNEGMLNLQDTPPNLRGDYFRICECGTKVNRSAKTGKLPACIHIEHTVPGDVYMNDAINQFNSGNFGLNEFKDIFNAVSICLVTKGEDKLLNKYRDTMPPDVDYKQNPFARYDATGVKIWKHCNQCQGVANCKNLTFMTQPILFGSSEYRINPNNDTELQCRPNSNSNWSNFKLNGNNGKICDLLLSKSKSNMEIYTDQGIYVLDLQGNIKRK